MTKSSLSDRARIVEFAARENIIRFERLLGTETDANERARILRLLAKERRTLSDIMCEPEPGADGQADRTAFHLWIFDYLALPHGTFEGGVAATLEGAIRLAGGRRGNVQLPAGDRLYIVENRGFNKEFLDAFREVRIGDGSACARAFEQRRLVIVPDVIEDAEYGPLRSDAAKAGYRGVITIPIATPSIMMGFVSVHFADAHKPAPIELRRLESFCAVAANHLQRLLGADRLDLKASRMQAAAYKRALAFRDPNLSHL